MSTILATAGRLISTSDLKLATKLHKIVQVADITGGQAPVALRKTGRALSFMFRGEYYEIEGGKK